MAVVQIHRDKYILKQSTKGISGFQRSLWKFGSGNRYHGLCKHVVEETDRSMWSGQESRHRQGEAGVAIFPSTPF